MAAAAERAVAELRPRTRSVVITVGAEGACWADADGLGHVAAPAPSAVVDTTGAGGAFVGALAVRLGLGDSQEEAVMVGVRAGTFAVRGAGAQSSYPLPADIGLEPAERRVTSGGSLAGT